MGAIQLASNIYLSHFISLPLWQLTHLFDLMFACQGLASYHLIAPSVFQLLVQDLYNIIFCFFVLFPTPHETFANGFDLSVVCLYNSD